MNPMGVVPGWPLTRGPGGERSDAPTERSAPARREPRPGERRSTGTAPGSAEFSTALAGMLGVEQQAARPAPAPVAVEPGGTAAAEGAGSAGASEAESAAATEVGGGAGGASAGAPGASGLAGNLGLAGTPGMTGNPGLTATPGLNPNPGLSDAAATSDPTGKAGVTDGTAATSAVAPIASGATAGVALAEVWAPGDGAIVPDAVAGLAGTGVGAPEDGAPASNEPSASASAAMDQSGADPAFTVLEVEHGQGRDQARLHAELAESGARMRLERSSARGGTSPTAAVPQAAAAAAEREASEPMAAGEPGSASATATASLPAAIAAELPRPGEEDEREASDEDTAASDSDRAAASAQAATGPGEDRAGGRGSGVGTTASRGADFASRVARILELQDGIEAQPVTRVLLRLDDEGGAGARVRVGVQGGVVAADIALADPLAAGRMQLRLDELARALSRQGLEPGALQVESVARRQVVELSSGIGVGGAELDAVGLGRVLERGMASAGRDEGRARDPERRDPAANQERSRREPKREDEQ